MRQISDRQDAMRRAPMNHLPRQHGEVADEGSSAVEFALVLPFLVLLLFGIIQFGLVFYEWQGLHAAAREATRLASFSGAPEWSDVEARAIDAAAPIQGGAVVVELDSGGSWTTPAATDRACDGTTDEVKIRVRYQDPYEINVIFFSQSVAMYAESVFKCEVS